MKTTNLLLGIVILSMIMCSCSMGTTTDARIADIEIENPAHIRIADVKPGETFYIAVKISGAAKFLHETEPVVVDVSEINGNEPGTDYYIMNDEGINGDKVADDKIYTCAYTLPYGTEQGISGGLYNLNVQVKNIYNDVICEQQCELNIKGLPPVIEYAYMNGKKTGVFTHRTESDEIHVESVESFTMSVYA